MILNFCKDHLKQDHTWGKAQSNCYVFSDRFKFLHRPFRFEAGHRQHQTWGKALSN